MINNYIKNFKIKIYFMKIIKILENVWYINAKYNHNILTIIIILKYFMKLGITFFLLLIIYNYTLKEGKIEITKETYNLIKKINQYIIICRKGLLIEELKNYSDKPILTIIISLYNSAKTIKSSIRSVQNQKMKDIEIIVTEDSSTDNSFEIIKKLQEEDSRIKIIKNKSNKGALFSRSIGALNAKGKYITALDSDDLFINKEIFNICYQQSENYIDIIEFSGFSSSTELLKTNKNPIIPFYLKFKNNNEIILQPKLSNFIYERKNNKITKLIDGFICAKFIKNKTYKKALKFLGNWIYNEKVNFGEDRIVNFALFKVADSFKFIEEYGLIYYNISTSITNSLKNFERCHDELINIMSIFNNTKSIFESKIVIYELITRWNSTIYPGLNKKNKKYAQNLIKLILTSNYFSPKDKRKIQKLLQKL